MSAPRPIAGLREVASAYDAILCDVWGVIHNGREAFGGACAALARFQQARGPVVLISNAPRPSQDVKPQLRDLKVPDTAWSTTRPRPRRTIGRAWPRRRAGGWP